MVQLGRVAAGQYALPILDNNFRDAIATNPVRKARHADPSALLNALPKSDSTPELHLHLNEGENFSLMAKLVAEAKFPGNERIIDIDGLRVEYADGFGLARSSNTTPVIVMRFEAETPAALARIQGQFRDVILAAKPDAHLPF